MSRARRFRPEAYRPIDGFTLFDLKIVHLVLHGGSVLDWTRLALSPTMARSLCRVHGLDLADPGDVALIDRIRDEAVAFLCETCAFPIPGALRRASLLDLLAAVNDGANRHRSVCACTLLKTMQVINHFDAREARQALTLTDQQLFQAAEQRIYKTVSHMMASGLPVVEFMGGRKQRMSMVGKLLSKDNPLSAQLFDKMRFRIVTAGRDDVLPVVSYLVRNLFPFHYVLAGESYNTLLPLGEYCQSHPRLKRLASESGLEFPADARVPSRANTYSSPKYQVAQWVCDLPLRVPDFTTAFITDGVDPVPRPIVYVRTEIQILDRQADRENERGDASHRNYKARQLSGVVTRLKMGRRGTRRATAARSRP
ncbi:MAG: TIGR04552 family protein [Deltaproteobacteria bacterium]|nr:TIGR04552 family protein [Deltaproteobacteria bacterium]